MKKFSLQVLGTSVSCFVLSFGLKAQIKPPVLDSVSKGTFPNYIFVRWEHDFEKYPDNQVTFEVQRSELINPTKGKFGDWKPTKFPTSALNPIKVKTSSHENVLQDNSSLKARTWYAYQVKMTYNQKTTAFSSAEYGFIKDASKIGTAILYEPQEPYQFTWSAVQGATQYKLQIIENKPFNQDPEKGFYNVKILKEVRLTEPFYNCTGVQKDILWSVQSINGQDSSYFPHPLHSDSMLRYGANAKRVGLFPYISLNAGTLSFLVQNATQNTLTDVNIGIYLSQKEVFEVKEAILAKSLPLYLPVQQRVGFSETLQLIGYQYIHLVPVQSGSIMKNEIETILIR